MHTTFSIKQCLSGNLAENCKVMIQGWIKTRRDSKAGLSFLNVHDGSCFAAIQVVAEEKLDNYSSDITKLTAGCAVEVYGTLVTSQGAKQSLEIQADKIIVVGWVDNPDSYPIQAKRHSLEFLREVAHLRPRTNTIGAVMRIRNGISQAVHQFFHQQGFLWVHTPIITASDCEGAGEMFRVSTLNLLHQNPQAQLDFSKDFFGQETFLTVSGQLNVEAYCLALSKVYTFGPTFRAENSNTSRHLAEFWMIEPEIAFASLSDICQLSQTLLRDVGQCILDNYADDMAFFNQFVAPGCIERLENLVQSAFEIMSYTDAIAYLKKVPERFQYPVRWGLDLQSEHERYLAENLCQKPVILTDYPKEIKGFYMRQNDDGKTVAAMDVLAPGIGEIIGGSQREERLAKLTERLEECHLDKERYRWYCDLRRYGSVPHSGFGLGLERLVSYITGVANVRDVIPFPRTPGNAHY